MKAKRVTVSFALKTPLTSRYAMLDLGATIEVELTTGEDAGAACATVFAQAQLAVEQQLRPIVARKAEQAQRLGLLTDQQRQLLDPLLPILTTLELITDKEQP